MTDPDYDSLSQWDYNQCHEPSSWNPHAFTIPVHVARAWAFARSFQGFVLFTINLCMCIAGFRNRLYSNNASNTMTLVFGINYTVFGAIQTVTQLSLAFDFTRNMTLCRYEASSLCMFITAKVMLLLLASYERGVSVLHLRKVSPATIIKGVFASYAAALGSGIAHHIASPCPVIGASGTLCWPNFGSGTVEMAVLTYLDLCIIGGNVLVVMGVYTAIIRRLRTVFIRLSKKANALSQNPGDHLQDTKDRLVAISGGMTQPSSGHLPLISPHVGTFPLVSPTPLSPPGRPEHQLVNAHEEEAQRDSHHQVSATALMSPSSPQRSSAVVQSHSHHVHVVEEEPESDTQKDEKQQPTASTHQTNRFHTQSRQSRPTSMIMAKSERRRSALPLATPNSRRESVFANPSSMHASHWPTRQSVMDHFGGLLTGTSPRQVVAGPLSGSFSSVATPSIAPSVRSRASSGKSASVKGSQATSVGVSSYRVSPTVGRAARAAFWPTHRISIAESTSDRGSIRPASLQVSEDATIGSDFSLDAIYDDEDEMDFDPSTEDYNNHNQHSHRHNDEAGPVSRATTSSRGAADQSPGSSSTAATLKDASSAPSASFARLLNSGNPTMSRGEGADMATPDTPGSTTAPRRVPGDQMDAVDTNGGGGGLSGKSYTRLKSISFLGNKSRNAMGRISFSLKPKENKDHASGSTTPNGGKSRPNGIFHHHHQQHKNAHKLQMLRIESHLVRRGMWVIASFSISWAFILCQVLWAFTTQRRTPVDLEIVVALAAFFSPMFDPIAIMYVDARWRNAVFGLFPCCCRRRHAKPASAHHAGT